MLKLLFPQMKYEWWWLYVADRRNHLLITAPVQVCSLRTEEEVREEDKDGILQNYRQFIALKVKRVEITIFVMYFIEIHMCVHFLAVYDRFHFQIQLKFSAPPKVGTYQYTVILRADSYFDFDLYHNIKVMKFYA